NFKTTPEALPALITKKSADLFTAHGVFSDTELHSRFEIVSESYAKTIHIEALTMIDLVKSWIIPACVSYQNELAKLLKDKTALGSFDDTMESTVLKNVSANCGKMLKALGKLEKAVAETKKQEKSAIDQAKHFKDKVFSAMGELRVIVDELETMVAKKHWPLPSYAELLFSVI
ncbi:MAG: glutamine synthetase, partial [Firmicutes bacterium]|nr:glutamine synthetase [Bacillota bacterium]